MITAMALLVVAGCSEASDEQTDSGSPGGARVDQDDGAANTEPGAPGAPGVPWFEERAKIAGLTFMHDSGHRNNRYLYPEIACGGAALIDIDNDGDLDAYLVQAGPITEPKSARQPNRLYRNRGDGSFEDITEGSGADHRGYGMGVAAGDFNNDGLTDLYVTNYGPNVLLKNTGDGTFADITAAAGVGDPRLGASAAFLDYDADGDLDLYVVNYVHWSLETEKDCYAPTGERTYCGPASYEAPVEDILYRNNGDETFTDVSAEAGVREAFGNGLGVVCGDFNGDGRIDIYVANDGSRNQMWLNDGDGTFTDQSMALGTALDQDGAPKAGMGVCAADIDDDADLDVLVVNLGDESDSFYRNEDGRFFVDDTTSLGLRTHSRRFTRFGVALVDLNNDGYLDLYEANGRVRRGTRLYADDTFAEPNILFAGAASGPFEPVSPQGGVAEALIATSRAAVFGDIDNDGGIDILLINKDGPAHLLINTVVDRGNWIQFRVLNEHGGDALGATVSVSLDDRTIARDVRSAYSYQAANDPRVHVGLGEKRAVSSVIVTWPGGDRETFGGFDANQIITLNRGGGEAR